MTEEQSELISINLKKINSDNVVTLQVPSDIDIDALKVLASDETDIPADSMRLIFCGKSLKSQKKLSDYNVTDGKTILVFPGPQHELGTPEPEQQAPPLPPPRQPQVEVHIQNIVSDSNSSHNYKDAIVHMQDTINKLQETLLELQMADLEENEEQCKELSHKLYNETIEAEGKLIMNASVINSKFGDENEHGHRRVARRGHIITGSFPVGGMNLGNLHSILGSLGIPGLSGNNHQQNPPPPPPSTD